MCSYPLYSIYLEDRPNFAAVMVPVNASTILEVFMCVLCTTLFAFLFSQLVYCGIAKVHNSKFTLFVTVSQNALLETRSTIATLDRSYVHDALSDFLVGG